MSRITLAPVTGFASADSKYRYVVTDVRVAGAKNSADYTFNPASGSNWGAASDDKDYAFDDISFNFLGDSSHKLEAATEVNDQLIVLPQTATFSVTYSVDYLGDDGITWHKVMASATQTTPRADFTVEDESGKWRSLSSNEWSYLLNARKVPVSSASKTSYGEGSVNGKSGLIILPAAGRRSWSSLYDVGSKGYYWYSTPSETPDYAIYLQFWSDDIYWTSYSLRHYGKSVRLVCAAR